MSDGVEEGSGSHRRPEPEKPAGTLQVELKHIVAVVVVLAGGSLGGGGLTLLRGAGPAPPEVTAKLEVISKSVDEMNTKLTKIEDHQDEDTRGRADLTEKIAKLDERVRALEIKVK